MGRFFYFGSRNNQIPPGIINHTILEANMQHLFNLTAGGQHILAYICAGLIVLIPVEYYV
jgi:hypothetical protein